MSNVSEPINFSGLAKLANGEFISPDINVDDLEKEIINGINKDTSNKKIETDMVAEFKHELDALTIDLQDVKFNDDDDMLNDGEELPPLPTTSFDEIKPLSSMASSQSSNYGSSTSYGSGYGSNANSNGQNYSSQSYGGQGGYGNGNGNSNASSTSYSNSSTNIQNPNSLSRYTEEQIKRKQIDSVLSDIGETGDFSMDNEKKEDEKASLLEQIDMLTESLEDEGINLSRIPKVSSRSSYEEIESVYRTLRLKNDRKRYTTLAEEIILAGAYGLENIFNGERVILGRYKPDLTDWHQTVNMKLRRMRFDTSSLVSDIMQDYNIGSGMRIAFELIPSLFTHSRLNKHKYKNIAVSSEADRSAAITALRDME